MDAGLEIPFPQLVYGGGQSGHGPQQDPVDDRGKDQPGKQAYDQKQEHRRMDEMKVDLHA